MMKRARKWIITVSFILTAVFTASGTACGASKDGGKLSTPENVRVENRVLYWDEVKNADYYVVSASNGKRYETTECQVELTDLQKSGTYKFNIFAKSHNEKYEVSKSASISYELAAPVATGEDKYHFKYKWVEELNGYEVAIGNAVLQDELILPDYFRDYPVKKIADKGFTFAVFRTEYGQTSPNTYWYDETTCNTITKSIRFPQYLEVIGLGAFYALTEMEEVIIPEEVTEIQDFAFGSCAKLKKVTFPNGLKKIGEGAFAHTALETLDLPDRLTAIGTGAFACPIVGWGVNKYHVNSALSRVEIPNMIKEIGTIFEGRENLTAIVFQGVEYTYSATQPTEAGNYWYWGGRRFAIWE